MKMKQEKFKRALCVTSCSLWFVTFCLSSCLGSETSDLTSRADVVYIASLISKVKLNEVPSYAKPGLPFGTLAVKLNVSAVLKGTLSTREITLKTYYFDWTTFNKNGGGTVSIREDDFSDFQPNLNYLIFARKLSSDNYSLIEPVLPSAWKTNSPSSEISDRNSPLENVYLQYLSSAASQNPNIRNPSLLALSDLGEILTGNAAPSDIQDVDVPALIVLTKTHVIPVVLSITKINDERTQALALYAAGCLQVTQVIPQLVILASSNSKLSDLGAKGLSKYRKVTAVPKLCPLLKSNNRTIKSSVLISLQQIQAPQELPYLLDVINDTDIDFHYQVMITLFEIAKVKPLADESQWQTFWKDWALSHHDEIEKLRQQVKAESKGAG